jgi:ATP-dependent Lon protease
MAAFEDPSFSLQHFTGTVRLFPLPNLVMFPHVLQPLHVFEPRYRALLEETLADDQLIAMAVLSPGWEADYEGRPPIFPMACLGRIVSHHQLEDGAYNVLLLGLQRVRLVRELHPAKSFREAEVEVCEDYYPPADAAERAALHRKLGNALRKALPFVPQAREQLDQLMAADLPLGVLADIISYLLDIDLGEKKSLLLEADVHVRVKALLDHLAVAAADSAATSQSAADFPPEFSPN